LFSLDIGFVFSNVANTSVNDAPHKLRGFLAPPGLGVHTYIFALFIKYRPIAPSPLFLVFFGIKG
jgi:hypothetical protein